MSQELLDSLFTVDGFVAVSGVMLFIGSSLIIIDGAWRAYKFVRDAVKGG